MLWTLGDSTGTHVDSDGEKNVPDFAFKKELTRYQKYILN